MVTDSMAALSLLVCLEELPEGVLRTQELNGRPLQ
jgi:hypothetical protein